MNELLAMIVPVLGRALLNFLWQGALIGLVAAVLLQLLRNAHAQVRYAVACLALLACTVAPVADVARQLAESNGNVAPAITEPGFSFVWRVSSQVAEASAWTLDDALPWIVALWGLGACILSLRMAVGVWWIRRLCSAPQGDDQREWQARLDALAVRFGLRRVVALRLVDSLATPASVGWWRPVVLLPTALLTRMPVELIEALLAHELAHIRRHDYFVNLLQGAVEAMLFYHPVTWWLSRQIRIEREHVADQLAVEITREPRRLAFALSELSGCFASAPTPSLALAAHGGRLMSRIEQLVRPGRRSSGGRIAFPLIGMATACLAFYAHAQIPSPSLATPAAVPAPPVLAVSAVAPVVSTAQVAAASPAPAASPTPVAKGNFVRVSDSREGTSYAVVRKDGAGYVMSGSGDDRDDIDAAKLSYGGDFVWFRKDRRAYVIDDPATVNRATTAWADTDKLGKRMEALGSEMSVHGKKMEALGRQMEQVSARHAESAAMKAAGARMETLGRQQEQLAAQQARLALQMGDADEARREQLSRDMAQLSRQQESLGTQMEAQSKVMEAEGTRLEQQLKPMEALGRQMEEAGKPMEALGEQMDALGEQMDRLSAKAERDTLALIEEATAKGLAKPAPVRR